MSELERAFISSADKTYKKVEAKDGRTMHFKDGTPISQNAFNAASGHVKHEGEKPDVAIPSAKGGPGYRRIEVTQEEASALGQQLRLLRDDVPGQPVKMVELGGEWYDVEELAELNEDIIDRHGADAVMKY